MRFQWRTADAIAMSSIFRKGKYRLVWLVLAIALVQHGVNKMTIKSYENLIDYKV
ncbi:MAG: hypothetical protein ACK5WC_14295 [Aphanizomenon sp.]